MPILGIDMRILMIPIQYLYSSDARLRCVRQLFDRHVRKYDSIRVVVRCILYIFPISMIRVSYVMIYASGTVVNVFFYDKF